MKHSLLLAIRVPEICRHIEILARPQIIEVYVGRVKLTSPAEISTHCPLGIRCDQDQADSRGSRAAAEIRLDAAGGQSLSVHLGMLVIPHPAGKAGGATEK